MGECYLHTVEVASSKLAFPTIRALKGSPFLFNTFLKPDERRIILWEDYLELMVSEV